MFTAKYAQFVMYLSPNVISFSKDYVEEDDCVVKKCIKHALLNTGTCARVDSVIPEEGKIKIHFTDDTTVHFGVADEGEFERFWKILEGNDTGYPGPQCFIFQRVDMPGYDDGVISPIGEGSYFTVHNTIMRDNDGEIVKDFKIKSIDDRRVELIAIGAEKRNNFAITMGFRSFNHCLMHGHIIRGRVWKNK